MNAVIYYSNTGQSFSIAKHLSDRTCFKLVNLNAINDELFNNIFLVFPVHYQSIPKEIRQLFKNIKAHKAVVVATYGKMGFGDVLNDVKKLLPVKVVGGAYVPTKHTYIENDESFAEFERLNPLIEMFDRKQEVRFPTGKKNLFASFMPIKRHQISVKITRNDRCTKCGECNKICEHIKYGIPNKKCNRCLKCVKMCPQKALEYKLSATMVKYLSKPKIDSLFIY